ncbi:hypothetical protein [uncultured Jatrophihabitans sp.]|uniref:T3SS (YopN, CesT) and YbjN peptide-binding chaperone 1 n=1 Tax=uncultured Jatrophihabitans sp. TaxID=1610747 RepID=UPI0035C9EE78
MGEVLWIRSHVEQLLEHIWSICRVAPDDDGDYPFRQGTAACWVAVLPTAPVMVRVFAHAALDLKPSLRLFRELNDIERRALSCAVLLEGDAVVVSQTVSPIGLTAPVLEQALHAVAGVAEDIGLLLAAMFGGETPYPPEFAGDSADVPPGPAGPF